MSNLHNKDQLYNREERIIYLFRWILLKGDLSESEQLMSNGERFTEEQTNFINKIINEIEYLEEEIIKHIPSTWPWDRFNYTEKAVMINAAAELLLANNKRSIVIDESLEFSKVYCGDKAAPLINGVLDKIGK